MKHQGLITAVIEDMLRRLREQDQATSQMDEATLASLMALARDSKLHDVVALQKILQR